MIRGHSMANDTRSGGKNKDEEGNSSKKKSVDSKRSSTSGLGRTDSSASRKSAREISRSPLNTRKSERLEKRTPQTPPVKRKSERIEKQISPSPLRRSERGKKDASSSSLGSKHSMKGFNSSDVKRKKEKREKSLTQLTAESADVSIGSGQNQESVGEKRKRMDARSYKALFRAQIRRDTAPDIADKLERMDVLPDVERAVSQGSASKQMDHWEDKANDCVGEVVDETREECLEVEEETREECLKRYSEEDTGRSSSSSPGSVADILETGVEVDLLNSRSRDSVAEESPVLLDVDGLKHSKSSSTVAETLNDAERKQDACSGANVLQELELVGAASLGGSAGGNNLGIGSQCIQPKKLERTTPTYDDKGICPLFTQSTSPSGEKEDHVFWGICGECSKQRRVKHDSPKQELCTCNVNSNKDLDDNSCHKGKGDLEATIMSKFAERLESSVQSERTSIDVQMDGHKKVCVICNQGEELLFCDGKGCEKCYHISCLDPPLDDVPPGIWHCIWCVKKKVELGVYSVSEGVESIWDSRKVEVSDSKGKHWQKQYLVKYQGLAHVHNHWVPETVLLSEASYLVDKFNQKQQGLRWNSEWMRPHRLLRKRSLIFPRQQEHCNLRVGNIAHCQFEWLVKWCDLGYEHATWELENAHFLCSSLGQKLVREFEIRWEKAKRVVDKSNKGSYVKLTKLPGGAALTNYSNLLNNVNKLHEFWLLNNVNKLREFWYKCQNAVVLDDHDRVRSAIFFILSLSEIGCPFLVIATSEALFHWEAEFMRLAPSVDLVVYAGNKETRRSIRALEFYDEGGQVMLQVLLSSPEAVLEDFHTLRQLSWGAILIDECHSRICTHFEPMKMLSTTSRVVLFTSQLKDTVEDYLDVLSFLDFRDSDKTGSLKCNSSDSLDNLKERLSRFIAYRCNSESTKFVEYWIPVQISNLQLEQYCATLLSNSTPLCSCSKNDPVGALREILITLRKCCDHPYMVDPSLRPSLTKGLTDLEILDVGTKASGKLQLLDMILSEIKARQQRVLVLFQSFVGSSGTSSLPKILEEVCLRFGQDSYEYVDARLFPTKKQVALNRFNDKDSGRFILLMENRACASSIKLSSIDTVVIFNSDWNPGNDLRALQKISIDSQFQQIKVFRLYAACTIEEKVLIHAKQDVNIENYLENRTRSYTDTFLRWGAFYLFNRLEEYHGSNNETSPADVSFGELLAHDVLKEFLANLTEDSKNKNTGNSIISKAQHSAGVYFTNRPVFGEHKVQSTNEEEPHIFWRKLLEGRNPQWRYPCCPTPRNRKRVEFFNGSSKKPESGTADVAKKRRKVVNSGVNLSSIQTEPTAGISQVTPVNQSLPGSTASENGTISLNNTSNFNSHGSSLLSEGNPDEPGESLISNEQKSLHIFLKTEMAKLCELLALSDGVKKMVGRFLEYVMENHRVSKEPASILHALQISMCWIGASILKNKMDKKESLMLAKQRLNFECTEEQANYVYMKLRMLKKTFLQQSEVINDLDSLKNSTSAEEFVIKESSDARAPEPEAVRLRNMKSEKGETTQFLEGRSQDQEPVDGGTLSEQEHLTEDIQEFLRIWEDKRSQLEKEHRLEAVVIRSIHRQHSVRVDKLRVLDTEFAKKLKELEHLKEARLQNLKAMQLASRNEERQKSVKELAEMRSVSEPGTSDEVHVHASESRNIGCFQATARATCNGVFQNNTSLSGQHIMKHTPKEMVNDLRTSDAAPPSVGTRSVSRSPLSTDKEHNSNEEFVSAKHPTSDMETHDITSSGEQNEVVPANSPKAASVEVTCTHDADVNEATIQYNEETERGDRVDSDKPDCLGNQRDKAESSITGNTPSSEAPLGEACNETDHGISLPSSQAPQDEVPLCVVSTEAQDIEDHPLQDGCLMSTEVHDVDQLVTENQSIAEADVAPARVADVGPTAQSNYEASCEQLEPVVESSSLCGFQSQAREGARQSCDEGSILFQASESTNLVEEPEISHQVLPENGETMCAPPSTDVTNPNICDGRPDLQPLNSIRHEPSGGLSITSEEGGAPLHVDRHTTEPLNHVVPQPGLNINNVQAPIDRPMHPTHQRDLRNPSQSLNADPLQNELERLRKETELAIKGHEDMKLRLRSDCEKEIEEVIAQIRKKYEEKLQDTEATFLLKKNELDTTLNKVFLNKVLADAVRSKCLDLKPSGLTGIQQGLPSGFMQHMHQLSLQSTLRPSPLAGSSSAGRLPATQQNMASTVPAARPPATQQNTASTVQAARPPATQQNTASTVPAVPRSAALSAAVPSRPLHISTITPSTANMRVGGEIRAPAPHLQTFRPSVSAPATNLASLPRSMPSQPVLPPPTPSLSQIPPIQPSELLSRLSSQSAALLPLHSQANQSGAHIRPTEPESGGPAVTQNIHPSAVELPHSQANESWSPIRPIEPESGGLAATQKTHPSAVELLMDVHNRQSDTLRSNISPPLADAGSNFDSTNQSDLATARRVQDSLTTSALAADVVCLSDDE